MNLLFIQLVLSAGAILGQESEIEFLNCPIIPRLPGLKFEDYNALGVAAAVNSTEDLKTFLASGCDINYNGTFWTDIQDDCEHILFKRLGISCVRVVKYSGYTALNLAVIMSSLEVVKLLVEVPGIDLDAGSTLPNSYPVFNAARAGDLDKLKVLVAAGASLDFRGGEDELPVMTAAVLSESVPTVSFLLNTGLDLNQKDNRQGTPAAVAAAFGYLDILKLLRNGGADLSIPVFTDNQTLIMQAIRNNQTEVVDYLIGEGLDVNAVDSDCFSNLAYAAELGNVAIVESLLDAGADIDFLNTEDERPALFQAISSNRTDTALVLLQRGAQVNIKTSRGFTSTYVAVEVGKFSVRNILMLKVILGWKSGSLGGAHQCWG